MRARKDFGHEELSLEIDGVPQPPEIAAQRSEVREVVSDLDRLPDRQRTALLLSVFEGLGYDEIALRLDTSPNSVRALLSRARGHLRKAAAAIAPLPLLQAMMKKISALAGAGGCSQGTIAAGGSVIQAKLVAVAATTVVAGAATAERAAPGQRPGDRGPGPWRSSETRRRFRPAQCRSTSARCSRTSRHRSPRWTAMSLRLPMRRPSPNRRQPSPPRPSPRPRSHRRPQEPPPPPASEPAPEEPVGRNPEG